MRYTICLLLTAIFVTPGQAATTQIPSSAVPASATKITFETDPQGNPVPLRTLAGSIWASQGVTFDSNDMVGDPVGGAFTITSPPNVLSGDTVNAFQPIHATFNPPVSLVGAWGFDFVLDAFDQQGHLLGEITHTNGSPGFSGPSEVGFLGFTSDVPIAMAEFSSAFPNNGIFGYHIDDLVFVAAPEPGTLMLAMLGVGLLLFGRRGLRLQK